MSSGKQLIPCGPPDVGYTRNVLGSDLRTEPHVFNAEDRLLGWRKHAKKHAGFHKELS